MSVFGGNQKIVDRILDKRERNEGKIEYLIKWSGCDLHGASWEFSENLTCSLKVQEFERVLERVQQHLFGQPEKVTYMPKFS